MTKGTKKTNGAANKRNLLFAFLAGIGVVLSCAQSSDLVIYAKDVLFNDDVAKLSAANVQEAVEKVAAKADSIDWSKVSNRPDVQALQTEIAALKAQLSGDCPAGYTKDTTVTAYTLCKNGKDEVVKVGDFWVDRYETSIVDAATYNGGKCDGSGTQYGAVSDDYPATFPDSAKVTTKLYACSTNGNVPSRSMTWFQAVAACVHAGKHLCTNGEWQAAAFGTPDDAYCNLSGATKDTGSFTNCVSQYGAFDMVGNVWEWVDLWGQGGETYMGPGGVLNKNWPASGGYGDGQDGTWNVNGTVEADNAAAGVYTQGLPAAMLRGGNFGPEAGVFTLSLQHGPSRVGDHIGARCCRR